MDVERWEQVVALHARVEQELGRALQRHGLSPSEYRALCRLEAAVDGELRMQELAEQIGLNQSSVSRLVARLERDGLTRRDLCPDDRRGVYTVITDRGRARRAEVDQHYRGSLADAMSKAAADERMGAVIAALTVG